MNSHHICQFPFHQKFVVKGFSIPAIPSVFFHHRRIGKKRRIFYAPFHKDMPALSDSPGTDYRNWDFTPGKSSGPPLSPAGSGGIPGEAVSPAKSKCCRPGLRLQHRPLYCLGRIFRQCGHPLQSEPDPRGACPLGHL